MVYFDPAIDTAVFSSDNFTFRSIFLGQKGPCCWLTLLSLFPL